MEYFPPPEKKASKLPVLLALFVFGGLAYYVYVHIPRPRQLRISGPDSRMNGVYELLADENLVRQNLTDHNLAHPTGKWAAQVWKHTTGDAHIYDHDEHASHGGLHTWSIGPWDATAGGAVFLGRYGYIHISAKTIEAKVPGYKKGQTFGISLGTLNPVQSHDVLQFAAISNGWDPTNWPTGGGGKLSLV